MSARTYDQDHSTLPPLTKAIADTYGSDFGTRSFGGRSGRPFDPVFTTEAFSAMLDAIHALETRLIALET